ncbi:hypothetical protein PENSPDRAFT_82198 [Peniophora sp. CONT]|nr:hypothetical protein PENSPDRAFT_82198 [Peniophora sp. CONT]
MPTQSRAQAAADQVSRVEKDRALALRLANIIEDANHRVGPIVRLLHSNIEKAEREKDEERDEGKLVENVRPLLEEAQKILFETRGAVEAADPDDRIKKQAERNVDDHVATPEDQRLASALKTLVEQVGGSIDWCKEKLAKFPKAEPDLGPLLEALSQPLFQILTGVGLLLHGVLTLVENLLAGIGLHKLVRSIVALCGFKGFKPMGPGKWMDKRGIPLS